jgi:hypothetical protein
VPRLRAVHYSAAAHAAPAAAPGTRFAAALRAQVAA